MLLHGAFAVRGCLSLSRLRRQLPRQRERSVSKNSVFDTLGGCLKGRRGKECASVGLDKAIRAASFPKRNIFPFGLSHLLPYTRMAAFFDFPNEKIFSFPIEDFRPIVRMSGAAPDRGMLVHGERRVTMPIAARSCRKNDGARIALSADTVRGARRRKQKRWPPGANRVLIIQRERIGNSRFLSWHYIAFAACGLF